MREAHVSAEKEYVMSLEGPHYQPQKGIVVTPPRRTPNQVPKEWCQGLKIKLLRHHPEGTIKTILFAGTTHGAGSSATAINFAITLAKDCQLKVLLAEVNLRTPRFHELFKSDQALGLSDLLTGSVRVASRLKVIRHGNLYVLPWNGNLSGPVGLFESSRFDQVLKIISEQFDYVILDGPPVLSFSESGVICTKVDGVVLVLESGKTRQQVALRAKKELEEAGGKLLGLVLNRRKYYIPEWIYKRL
jgi:capsular exopolysaccharide synthesis family protein